jgi:hypothetical protein
MGFGGLERGMPILYPLLPVIKKKKEKYKGLYLYIDIYIYIYICFCFLTGFSFSILCCIYASIVQVAY